MLFKKIITNSSGVIVVAAASGDDEDFTTPKNLKQWLDKRSLPSCRLSETNRGEAVICFDTF